MAEIAAYIAMEIMISIIALVDNTLVLMALWRFKALRTPTNWFVCSLAVADIAVAVFAIPSAIVLRVGLLITPKSSTQLTNYTTTASGFDETSASLEQNCHPLSSSVSPTVCLLIVSSVIFLTQVSIFGLLLIAVDRFIAIEYPLQYHRKMTSTKVRWAIVGTWFLGVLFGLVPELGWNNWNTGQTVLYQSSNSIHGHEHCRFEEIISMQYMVFFNFFLCVLTPLVAMLILYIIIFRSAKKQLLKIYSDVAISSKSIRQYYRTQPQTRNASITSNSSAFIPKYYKRRKKKKSVSIVDEFTSTSSAYPLMMNGNGRRKSSTSPQSHTTDWSTQELGSRDLFASTTPSVATPIAPGFGVKLHNVFSAVNLCDLEKTNKTKTNHTTLRNRSRSFSLVESELSFFRVSMLTGQRSIIMQQRRTRSFKVATPSPQSSPTLSDDDFNCRPRGKAFSFTTTTRSGNGLTKKRPTIRRYQPNRENERRESTDETGSSMSLYTSQHGVWSAVDRSVSTPKMRRRRTELLKKEFRAARSLATVVGMFALCWLPLHILNCVTYFCPTCPQPDFLTDLAIILSHANSTINPLIYAFKLRDFKVAFRKIMKGALRKTSFRRKRRNTKSSAITPFTSTSIATKPRPSLPLSNAKSYICFNTRLGGSTVMDSRSCFSVHNQSNICNGSSKALPAIKECNSNGTIHPPVKNNNVDYNISKSTLSGLENLLTKESVI